MSQVIKAYEQECIQTLMQNKHFPDFKSGDTVRVSIRVIDGTIERVQLYEGVVIAKRNKGLTSSFVVRKVSHGEGVERRFLTYSPIIAKIDVIKYGAVRRAKLFYLRNLSGKSARIPEKKTKTKLNAS